MIYLVRERRGAKGYCDTPSSHFSSSCLFAKSLKIGFSSSIAVAGKLFCVLVVCNIISSFSLLVSTPGCRTEMMTWVVIAGPFVEIGGPHSLPPHAYQVCPVCSDCITVVGLNRVYLMISKSQNRRIKQYLKHEVIEARCSNVCQ